MLPNQENISSSGIVTIPIANAIRLTWTGFSDMKRKGEEDPVPTGFPFASKSTSTNLDIGHFLSDLDHVDNNDRESIFFFKMRFCHLSAMNCATNVNLRMAALSISGLSLDLRCTRPFHWIRSTEISPDPMNLPSPSAILLTSYLVGLPFHRTLKSRPHFSVDSSSAATEMFMSASDKGRFAFSSALAGGWALRGASIKRVKNVLPRSTSTGIWFFG